MNEAMPSRINNLAKVYPDLRRMIHHYAKSRFIALGGGSPCSIGEDVDLADFVFGSSLVLVLLASQALNLTLKFHYSLRNVGQVHKIVRSEGKSELRRRQLCQDFFREYANLTAGALKGELQARGLGCGISLPVVTGGLDELFYARRGHDYTFTDHFRITGPDASFVVSATVHVFDSNTVAAIQFMEDSAMMNQGEIEFF